MQELSGMRFVLGSREELVSINRLRYNYTKLYEEQVTFMDISLKLFSQYLLSFEKKSCYSLCNRALACLKEVLWPMMT